MAVALNWISNHLPCCLYIADGISRGVDLVDDSSREQLEPHVTEVDARLAGVVPVRSFWRHLMGQSSFNDAVVDQVTEHAIRKATGRFNTEGLPVQEIANNVRNMYWSYRKAQENLPHELNLRSLPLRGQWDAKGPGLMREIGLLTDESLVVDGARAALVPPVRGGGGAAHLPYNCIFFEAVLADADPALPEVCRLAWLVAQLNLDIPIISEAIHAKRLPHVAGMAMLPAVLKAAEVVELARLDIDRITKAIDAWRLILPPDIDGPALLMNWWETYQESRPRFNVALTALDQMIG